MATLLLLIAFAEPSLADIFDPFSKAFPTSGARVKLKQASFERHIAARGAGAIFKAFRQAEKGIAEARKQRDATHKRFLRMRDQYQGWMAAYGKKYRKKHKQEPATYPMPDSLEKDYIAHELAMKKANSLILRELGFHRWAVDRLAELAPSADKKYVAALRAGLRAKHPHQRLRAVRLLALVPDGAQPLQDALRKEKHAGVAAALAASGRCDDLTPAIFNPSWCVRSGAYEALGRRGGKESVALLVRRWREETGAQEDDLHEALCRIHGRVEPDWEEWWKSLPADWKPGPPQEPAKPKGEAIVPTRTASHHLCFGLDTGSERFVLCVDGSVAQWWSNVEKEVNLFLRTVPERGKFGLVVFGAGCDVFKKKLVDNNGTNREAAKAWLAKRKLFGRNDVWTGLDRAFDLAGGASGKSAKADTIILMSLRRPAIIDVSPALVTNPRQILYELEERNWTRRIRILAYGRSSGGESFYLQGLAKPYGGGFNPSR